MLWGLSHKSLEDAGLRNYTQGPALETYGPNLRVIGIIVVLGGLFCGLAIAVAVETQSQTAWAVALVLTAGFAGLLLHHLTSRVWVHETGISFRGLFGYRELRWPEI